MIHDAAPVGSSRRFEAVLPVLLLMLVPAVVLTGDRALIFNPAGSIDPWVYYGLYRNTEALKALFPTTYYPTRLSLILPGYLANQIFQPLTANYVLHVLIWVGAVAGLFLTVTHVAGRRSALVAATVFGFYPYLWKAAGWDQHDGVGNVYYLLTMAFLTLAAASKAPSRPYLCCAGVTCACAVYCNLTWAFLLPSFGPYWLAARKARGLPVTLGLTLLWSGAGFLLLTLFFAIVNYGLGGSLNFYLPSITYALEAVKTPSTYTAPDAAWITSSPWLFLPAAAVLAGPVALVRARRRQSSYHARMAVALYVNLLFCAGVLILWELAGEPMLQTSYYGSYLLGPTFLFLGVTTFSVPETLRPSRFFALLAGVVGVSALVWWDSTGGTWLWLLGTGWGPVLAIAGVVAAGLVAGRTRAVAITVLGIGILSLNSRLMPAGVGWGRPSHAEDAFLRIVEGIEIAIDAARAQPDRFIRFWYEAGDVRSGEFSSINSAYFYLYSKFPDYPMPPDWRVEGLTAVLSSLPDEKRGEMFATAQSLLRQRGFRARVAANHVIDRGGVRYVMTIIEIEQDAQADRDPAA